MSSEVLKNMLYITQLMCDLSLSLVEEMEKENQEEEEKCKHQNKINLTTMGGPEKWTCRDCGYEYVEEPIESIKEKALGK